MNDHDISGIASHFQLAGPLAHIEVFGNGHINETFCLTCQAEPGFSRTVLQRINQNVFKNPHQVIENGRRVTEHIAAQLRSLDSPMADRQLYFIETLDGRASYTDRTGNVWRMVNRIERAVTLEIIENEETAFETARMFGWFLRLLTDLPAPPLHQTIPDFHNTPQRLQTFLEVLHEDRCNVAAAAGPEIDFVLKHADLCTLIQHELTAGDIPVRTTHNDTKVNNVMLDQDTHQGVCVIDLDTVMPGSLLYDFGDMVRTATNPADEDTQDLSQVCLRLPIFEHLVRGFVQETHGFLTPAEKKYLAFSGQLITFEQMIRFLTDYLTGNVYYKVQHDHHNLDRARTQMRLVQSMMDQAEDMARCVEFALCDHKTM